MAGDRVLAVAGAPGAAGHDLAAGDADVHCTVRPASAETAGMASRMASAARTARSASLPWATGAPNTAMTQSPTCLSTRPPCSTIKRSACAKKRSRSACTSSASSSWLERGVAGEVGEEDRDLPALARGSSACPARSAAARTRRPQRSDRVEQLAPVADRGDAELLQVVGREAGQDLGVDLVVAERLLVPPQAEPAQPSPDVHPRPPIGHARPVGAVYPSRRGPTRPMGRHASGGALVLSGSSPIAGKAVRVAFDGGRLTSDAGVLLLADIERRLGIAERLARCIADPRSPDRVHHTR